MQRRPPVLIDRVDIGPRLQQELGDGGVAVGGSVVQRRPPALVDRVDVGFRLQQEIGDVQVAAVSGEVQRRAPIPVGLVRLRARGAQQKLGDGRVAAANGVVQWRVASPAGAPVDFPTLLELFCQLLRVAGPHSVHNAVSRKMR